MFARARAAVITFTLLIPLFGQAPNAELTGTVKDSSGAVVAGAQIVVTNEETGLKRQAKSNEFGLYTIALLPPGRYRTVIQQGGFRAVERKGLTLHVDEKAQIDFALEVGSVNETVTVQGEAPLLQTAEASQGAVLDNTKIVNLPLNGRNPFTLSALTPECSRRAASSRREYFRNRPIRAISRSPAAASSTS